MGNRVSERAGEAVPQAQAVPVAAVVPAAGGSGPQAIRGLQRSVGNHAVNRLLAADADAVVRRKLATTSASMSKLGGGGIAGMLGRSSFSAIRSTLGDYEKARTADKQAQLLARLDALCTAWLDENRKSGAKTDSSRRTAVEKLVDELPAERAAVSRAQAEQRYMGGLRATSQGAGASKAVTKAPGAQHRFSMLSEGGKKQVDKTNNPSAKAFIAENGLTDAEVAAIRIFTAQDYTYMNPVTHNDPDSFDYKQLENRAGDKMQDAREEGSLHSAMAIQGLEKIKPYEGPVYRGERHSEAVFKLLFRKGEVVPRNSLTSTTKKLSVAENFAHGVSAEDLIDASKNVAVIITITNTKGGSRDISKLTAYESEGEVVVLPGRKFVTKSIVEVKGSKYADKVKMATDRKPPQPAPAKWYEVTCEPVLEDAKPQAAPPAAQPAAAGSPGAPKPPSRRPAPKAGGHRLPGLPPVPRP